jgi:iron complex outermembrane receptor protein
VVTARRRDENLQNVSVAVTVFSADSLASYNITSIENLGALTPGLSFSSSTYGSLGASVAIRGQRPNDLDLSQTPSVGIYVDDVYQSSTMGLGAISLAHAASVEVLKGPAAGYALEGRRCAPAGSLIPFVTARRADRC